MLIEQSISINGILFKLVYNALLAYLEGITRRFRILDLQKIEFRNFKDRQN